MTCLVLLDQNIDTFREPWFRQIVSLDWDYIGRIRNCTRNTLDNGDNWLPFIYEVG